MSSATMTTIFGGRPCPSAAVKNIEEAKAAPTAATIRECRFIRPPEKPFALFEWRGSCPAS
jgi:hypothetical protein